MSEGRGECIYEVGVPLLEGMTEEEGGVAGLTQDEMDASVATLQSIADSELQAEIVLLRKVFKMSDKSWANTWWKWL